MEDIFPKQQEKNSQKDSPEINLPIQWEALEYKHRPKSNEWYWYVASFSLTLVLVAIFTHNFLLGVFAVLAGFTIAIYGTNKPKTVIFSIGFKGVEIGSQLYPYENFSSFWIDYEPPHKKEIIFESKKITVPRLAVPMKDTDPNVLRKVLAKFLKEEKKDESLVNAIGELIGF